MSNIIAIDPGEKTGWAVFRSGMLREAGTWHGRHGMSAAVDLFSSMEDEARVVVEEPGCRGPVDAVRWRALATLNQRVGHYEALAAVAGLHVDVVTVAKWKGGGKKKVDTQHDMRLLWGPRLGSRVMELDDNAWDAVGLGTWMSNQLRIAAMVAR